jgi:hypothetical protein
MVHLSVPIEQGYDSSCRGHRQPTAKTLTTQRESNTFGVCGAARSRQFAARAPEANCTVDDTIDVNDFVCFLQKFAAGP